MRSIFVWLIVSSIFLTGHAAISAEKNFYEVLGVSQSATDEDIIQAFRREAVRCHPDKNDGNKDAENEFKTLNEAYEVLRDPIKRREYDDTLSGNKETPFRRNISAEDVFSFWSQHKNWQTAAQMNRYEPINIASPLRWKILKIELRCTLEDIFKGYTLHFNLEDKLIKRYLQAFKTGLWLDIAATALLFSFPIFFRMPFHVGAGFAAVTFHKLLPQLPTKILKVTIPPGCVDKSVIKVGMEPEIHFIVRQVPHLIYDRNGDDIIVRKRLHPHTWNGRAIRFKVQTVAGERITAQYAKEEIYDGSSKVFKGYGMRKINSRLRGNFIVILLVR